MLVSSAFEIFLTPCETLIAAEPKNSVTMIISVFIPMLFTGKNISEFLLFRRIVDLSRSLTNNNNNSK
jgi:hypothetical protein